MNITNTIIVVYKIKDVTQDEREVIYNIAYINIKPDSKNKHFFFDDNNVLNKIPETSQHGHLYINNICPTGSVVSRDGEYRSTLIYWRMVKHILNTTSKLNSIYDEINEYFVDKFQDRKFLIFSHYYFPTDELRNKYYFELELMITKRKIEFFTITWFMFFYRYSFGTMSDHENIIFQKIMLKYKVEDSVFFDYLIKKHSIETIREFYHIINTNIRSTTDPAINPYMKTKLGQKFIPISLREIQFPFNILYKPWKEYFVNKKLSDLVINNICPGFPISGGWLFIKNTNHHIFDNPAQYLRMEKSVYAVEITKILNQARYLAKSQVKKKHTISYDDFSSFDIYLDKKSQEMVTSWLSEEFKILHDKIDAAILHSNSKITMSNVTFCIFSEYVGKTLYESFFITKNSKYYKQFMPNIFSEQVYDMFEKYMFELSYNIYCLQSKLGIIHGDLHLQNITLNESFYKLSTDINIKNPHVLYILDNAHKYLFETNFYNITIIDFSRCIINPKNINMFKDEKIHSYFDIVENIKEFEDFQKRQLVKYLLACKPEYKEYESSLLSGIRINFDGFFKILGVLDLFMVVSRLLSFLQFKKKYTFKPFQKSVGLLKKIHKECDLQLSSEITALIKSPNKNTDFIIKNIIYDIFEHKNVNEEIDPPNIIDIYNYNNDMKYSLNVIDKILPPFKEFDKLKSADNFIKNSIKRRQVYEDEMEKSFKVLLIIKKRQREKHIL